MADITTAEYLAQLLKDKKQIAAFPNVFLHLERILDEGNFQQTVFCFFFQPLNLIIILCTKKAYLKKKTSKKN
jgi:hypothetical protein